MICTLYIYIHIWGDSLIFRSRSTESQMLLVEGAIELWAIVEAVMKRILTLKKSILVFNYCVHKNAPLVRLLRHSVHILTSYVLRLIFSVLPSTSRSPSGIFPLDSSKMLYSRFIYACYMSRLFYRPWFDDRNNICCVQIIKFVLCNFC